MRRIDALIQRSNSDSSIRVFQVGDSFDLVIHADNICADRRHFVGNQYVRCLGGPGCDPCKNRSKISESYLFDVVPLNIKPLARQSMRFSFTVARTISSQSKENPLEHTVYRITREEDEKSSRGESRDEKSFPRYTVRPVGRIPAKLAEKINALPLLDLEKLVEEQYAPRDSLSSSFRSGVREYDRLPGTAGMPQSAMTPEYEYSDDDQTEAIAEAGADADAEADQTQE